MMRNLIGLFCMVAAVPLAFAVEMWGPEFDENQTNTHSHVRRRSLSHDDEYMTYDDYYYYNDGYYYYDDAYYHDDTCPIEESKPMLADWFGGDKGFYHGVASGDPLPDAVIIWTRYTNDCLDDVEIEFRIAEVDPNLEFEAHLDPSKNGNIKMGRVVASKHHDWVVKLDIHGLKPYTQYVYAFTDGVTSSDVGLTKTAPCEDCEVDYVTYCTFSCSNFPNGYFHAYDLCSSIKDLDLWIHTGDYLYEYGEWQTWARDANERWEMQLPKTEIWSLNDYRLRHATYVSDEGLRNLRRTAPMVATWDDHEITNNPYSLADGSESGAQNHQPTCPVDLCTAEDAELRSNYCNRDERDACARFNRAARAYLEWLPLRAGPGPMGCVHWASITQVIEWGKLASFVAFDTRISGRSKDPTLYSAFTPFGGVTGSATNAFGYDRPPVKQALENVAAEVNERYHDPKYSMISEENMAILESTMINSAEAGKPWQIWVAATMFASHHMLDLTKLHELCLTWEQMHAVQCAIRDNLDKDEHSFNRILVAMCQTQTSWNSDGFSGFSVQRDNIMNIAKRYANNFIILGGDVHDSWAWSVHDKEGDPVAVNLIATGTTSPSPWAGRLEALLEDAKEALGGRAGLMDLLEEGFKECNSELKYANVANRGFYAVKASKEKHITEYLLFDNDILLTNFADARVASGKITADHICDGSLETFADSPGSLVPREECGFIEFLNERPAVFDLPVPPDFHSYANSDYITCGALGCKIH